MKVIQDQVGSTFYSSAVIFPSVGRLKKSEDVNLVEERVPPVGGRATAFLKSEDANLGEDSCYSRSENSSAESEGALSARNCSPEDRDAKRRGVRFAAQCEYSLPLDSRPFTDQDKLDRLSPSVRGSVFHHDSAFSSLHPDSASLSSIDTSSSSDLWNVRAMPDVSITRLRKPPSLRVNPASLRHKNKGRLNPLELLTDELMVKIMSYLTSNQIVGVARVCRRFYFLAWEPELWKRVLFTGEIMDADRALKMVFQLLTRNGVTVSNTVENIVLSGCSKLTDRGLAIVARRCPSLKMLHLQHCINVTNGGLLDLTTRCASLNHLDVTGCPMVSAINVSQSGAERRTLPLQYLDMSDCADVDDTSLRLIVENCPQLQYLFLRRCHKVTDAGLRSLSSYCLMLKELSVSDCSMVSDSGLSELGRLGPSLRYLSIAKCERVTDAGVRQVARHCYRLRYLNLRGCQLVSDLSIEWLARSCTRMRSLDIGKCDVTDVGLKMLSENCPNLKKLSVKSCALVSDLGVQSVGYYCRGLQHLNIQDCATVTAEGYRTVKKYCRRCIIEHTNPGFF